MSLLDSLGTAFEGRLFARAVEPRAGEAGPHDDWEGTCLNCGTMRTGPHCHQCGQGAHVHRTMGAFLHDLAHGALHFEGKIWRTLPLLAWRPGKLTRRYVDGERARFVSPMALFLFSVFLMFAVFQLAGITPPTDLSPNVELGQAVSDDEARQELAQLRSARAKLQDSNPATSLVDLRIAALERQLGDRPASPTPTGTPEAKGKARGEYTGVAFIDHAIGKWRKNPGLMAYKLQSNGYKFSWLLIPLSLPFMWLLFAWRRRFGLYDHAVFVTYSLSFMTLFYVVLVLLGAVGLADGWLIAAATTIPIYHIYRQLRGAYELSRFSAAWRTVALTAVIFVVLFLFVDLLLVLGAVG